MSRDNVSEMARVMCGRDKDCLLCPVQTPCLMRNCAELLNAEGYCRAKDVALDIAKVIINEILPKHLNGHSEKALELSFSISNFISNKYD